MRLTKSVDSMPVKTVPAENKNRLETEVQTTISGVRPIFVHSTTPVAGYPNQAAALQMKIYSTIDPRWLPNRPVRASTQGWDLPSAKFPAPWIKFPARAKKFPAQHSREFAHKRLMLPAF
jgi:hypothetical protein